MDEEPPSAADDGSGSVPAGGISGPGDGGVPHEVLTPPAGAEWPAGTGPDPLPWDDDLPLALGEETEVAASSQGVDAEPAGAAAGADRAGQVDEGLPGGSTDTDRPDDYDDELDELSQDPVSGRRNALPRRVETWRSRSATGAIATAIAMGLQQVFEPERRRPAAVAEAPSDPYSDDDPVTVDYVPDDAEGTKVHVKPWLLQKGDPT